MSDTQKIEQTLMDLGFDKKERQVYMSLLPLGQGTATQLGKRTGIQRSTTKYYLDKLVERGVVSVLAQNKTFIYTAEPPKKIIQNLELKKQEVTHQIEKAGRIVSELEKIINPSSTLPKVRFFEGTNSYLSFTEESLKCKDKEILYINNVDAYRNVIPDEYVDNSYIKTRVEKNIHLKLLAVRSPHAEEYKARDKKENRETRFFPKNFFFEHTIFIFDDTTTIVSNRDYPSCVMITSKDITETMRTLFNFMWSCAEKK